MLAGLLAVGALTGCARAEAVPSASATPPTTDLSITMREVAGHGETSEFTLTCDPVGGDLPTAVVACDRLATTTTDPFAVVPEASGCRDVIEGPGMISVRGIWAGTPVNTQFSQLNSCESDRFDRVLTALGVS